MDEVLLHDVTLAILAGGQGLRMGRAKGTLTVGGEPILAHLLKRLDWPGPTLLVTAPGREHPPGWERFHREVQDAVTDQGPLRGVLTALEHATTELLVLSAVDMPLVPPLALQWLIRSLASNRETRCVMTGRMIDGKLQPEPFPSAFRSSARPLIEQRLAGNRRSVVGLIDPPEVICMEAPDHWPTEMWTNLNDPRDLEQFLNTFGR